MNNIEKYYAMLEAIRFNISIELYFKTCCISAKQYQQKAKFNAKIRRIWEKGGEYNV